MHSTTGVILPSATSTQFHLKDGQNLITFKGNFVVNGGVIQSGTITGFDAYYGNPTNHLIEASGHSISFAAFNQGLVAFKTDNPFPLYELLYGQPMTVNGSNLPVPNENIIGGFAADRLYGNNGHDIIYDMGGDDLLVGGLGDDRLVGDFLFIKGVPGNDAIYGGDDDDELDGSGGDDFLSGGPGIDELEGDSGNDTADYSEKVDLLEVVLNGPNTVDASIAGFVEDSLTNIENVVGGAGADRVTGDGFINRLVGNGGNDRLSGENGNDILAGLADRDKLKGGKDNDSLNGGTEHDVLKGGPGGDTFIFDVEVKARHSDRVVDFGRDDRIGLDGDIFTKLGDTGKLKGKFFVVGEQAKDGNDHIIYDNGKLAYDRDGKGGAKEVAFAKLKSDPDLAAHDLIVI